MICSKLTKPELVRQWMKYENFYFYLPNLWLYSYIGRNTSYEISFLRSNRNDLLVTDDICRCLALYRRKNYCL